jgi:hypothetical protein
VAVCAVVDSTNTVINLIVADPVDPPPSGCILAFKPDTIFVDLGYTWNGISFLDKEGNVCTPIEEQPTGLE